MKKTWFITGGSSGLGLHLVRKVLSHGERVTTVVRSPKKMSELVGMFPNHLTVKQLDVTDEHAVEVCLTEVLRTQSFDVVVNNAGQGLIGATEEMTAAQIRQQLDLLLLAPIQITRAFIPAFRRQRSGQFIQISSVGGQVAYPVSSPYHAAKFGLEGVSESVAKELAEFGVFCTIVEPGSTRTNFGSNLVFTDPLEAYRNGTVGKMRNWVRTADETVYSNDPEKLASEIFSITRMQSPPLRLVLGKDAYEQIHAELMDRLSRLEAQQEVACGVGY